jgi:hypothetical protein
MTDDVGGCLYLEPELGEFPHELDFRYCSPEPGPFKTDVSVKVFGRFNPNYYSDCVGGAVFQVYEITFMNDNLDASFMASNQSLPATANYSAAEPADSEMVGCCLTYSGIYRSEEVGCGLLELGEEDAVRAKCAILELTFQEIEDPGIPEGSKLEVTGNYRLFDRSPCQLGPLFNVIIFDIIEEGETIGEHRTDAGMY